MRDPYSKKHFFLASVGGFFVFGFFLISHLVVFTTSANNGLNEIVSPSLNKAAQEATFIELADSPLSVKENILAQKVGQVVGVILSFVSVIFFLFVFYGGFLWMGAQGNEDKITKAKKIITQSAVALFILFSSYLITLMVTNLAMKVGSGNPNNVLKSN